MKYRTPVYVFMLSRLFAPGVLLFPGVSVLRGFPLQPAPLNWSQDLVLSSYGILDGAVCMKKKVMSSISYAGTALGDCSATF